MKMPPVVGYGYFLESPNVHLVPICELGSMETGMDRDNVDN